MAMQSQGDPSLPTRVGIHELRDNLAAFVRRSQDGASFLITSGDEVVAELHPPAARQRTRRQPGALRGQVWMAPDFDTLPDDVLAAMEGGG